MATHESAPVAVRRRDGVAVIDLAGDVNNAAADALDSAWSEATSERPDAVVLNFEDAGYFISSGIALIVGVLA
jgi:anti-anti-sigma factor